MEDDRPNILCTKVDEHAGNWPSFSFFQLFRIAKQFLEPKFLKRPDIKDVSNIQSKSLYNLMFLRKLIFFTVIAHFFTAAHID